MGAPEPDRQDDEARTRVLRALLMTPVLSARSDAELFRLARRHADAVREWFERETGWRLVVEPQTVRLQTSHVPRGATAAAVAQRHPARARRTDPPFTRRRYVLLCLALAVLERSDPQVSLGRLADDIVLAARRPELEGVDFELVGRDQRADLVAAIRLLLGLGVLLRVAGDEDAYVAADGDALYDVDRRVLATMLSSPHSPGLVARTIGERPPIAEIERSLHAAPAAYTAEEVNRRLRHGLARRLLSDPVLYYDELDAEELAYLVGQRIPLTRRLCEATGLVAELRAEGIALVDPEDQLTDLRMPEQGTDGHATLLLAEHLTAAGPTEVGVLRRHAMRLAAEHASYWRRSTREPGAEVGIVDGVLDRLVGLGLVRVAGAGEEAVVSPLPALGRFAVLAPTVRGTAS